MRSRNPLPPCGKCGKPQEERFNIETLIHCRSDCDKYKQYEKSKTENKRIVEEQKNKFGKNIITAKRNFNRGDASNTKRAIEWNESKGK